MNSIATPVLVLVVFFAITFGSMAIAGVALTLIAKMSGWAALAEKYAAEREPGGVRKRFQSIKLGRVRYNNAVTFIFAEEGFYMALWGPFSKFGHKPLLIPWTDIFNIHTGKMLFWRYVQFDIDRPSMGMAAVIVNRETMALLSKYVPALGAEYSVPFV